MSPGVMPILRPGSVVILRYKRYFYAPAPVLFPNIRLQRPGERGPSTNPRAILCSYPIYLALSKPFLNKVPAKTRSA